MTWHNYLVKNYNYFIQNKKSEEKQIQIDKSLKCHPLKFSKYFSSKIYGNFSQDNIYFI